MAYAGLNVQFGEVSDGCFSSTKYDVVYYLMKDKDNPSWEIIPNNGGTFIVEFKASGNGKTYRHRSSPFSEGVKQLMEESSQTYNGNNYEVRMEKRHNLLKYFRKQ